ncbi:hypothetical protein MKW92_035365, partial [Papaver armeniacum]
MASSNSSNRDGILVGEGLASPACVVEDLERHNSFPVTDIIISGDLHLTSDDEGSDHVTLKTDSIDFKFYDEKERITVFNDSKAIESGIPGNCKFNVSGESNYTCVTKGTGGYKSLPEDEVGDTGHLILGQVSSFDLSLTHGLDVNNGLVVNFVACWCYFY